MQTETAYLSLWQNLWQMDGGSRCYLDIPMRNAVILINNDYVDIKKLNSCFAYFSLVMNKIKITSKTGLWLIMNKYGQLQLNLKFFVSNHELKQLITKIYIFL